MFVEFVYDKWNVEGLSGVCEIIFNEFIKCVY